MSIVLKNHETDVSGHTKHLKKTDLIRLKFMKNLNPGKWHHNPLKNGNSPNYNPEYLQNI